MPVIFTTMAFAPDYSNGGLTTSELRPNLAEENALRADQPDREIMAVLEPQPEDIIVEKQRYSVVRDFCGHGLGRIFHAPPSILHYG